MSMEDLTQPPIKRLKYETDTTLHIKSILPAEYTSLPEMEKVYIVRLEKKQYISQLMQEFSQNLPLHETLQFLKRVRQNELIICRRKDLSENQTLREYLQERLSSAAVEKLCENVIELEVPIGSCRLRWQYDIIRESWPCKFHPDKYLESLYSGTNFSEKEIEFHKRVGNLLLQISNNLESNKPCGACIDPRTNSIVAIATSQCDSHPLSHSSMVLIDYVARTQNPSNWKNNFQDVFLSQPSDSGLQTDDHTLAGILEKYSKFIHKNAEFKDLQFGAERVKTKEKITTEQNVNAGDDNLAKYGPYLCTGYDIYLTEEPCLMCAMALVHSRARRIFFIRPSISNGALCTRFKLQDVKELNHHYEVFQIQAQSNSNTS